MDPAGNGTSADRSPAEIEQEFRRQLQQLEHITRELGSRGEVGDDPTWVQDYVYRIFEVGEALRELSISQGKDNPSHKSYR